MKSQFEPAPTDQLWVSSETDTWLALMHLALPTSTIPYMQSVLGATAVSAGNLVVLLQHSGPHHVHITMQMIQ